MQTYDPKKVARVWERVQNHGGMEMLPELIGMEWLDSMTYMALSRRFQGRDSQLLRQLAQQEQDHAACLRGIYTLATGRRPVVSTPVMPKEDPEALLRKSYGSHMQRLARYEARKEDPEYGQIFSQLAQQERDQCQKLLALLGRMSK